MATEYYLLLSITDNLPSLGVNIIEEFKPNTDNKKYGYNLIVRDYFKDALDISTTYVVKCILCEDSMKKVFHTGNVRTNKITTLEVYTIENFPLFEDYEFCYEGVCFNGLFMKYCKFRDENIIDNAIANIPHSIEFIENPTNEIKNKAVDLSPECIKYIKNLSYELCYKAVLKNPNLIDVVPVEFQSRLITELNL
jgi:hypothetical protein